MANEEDWPVSRRDEQAVLDILDSPEHQEETEFEERMKTFYEELDNS
jgi:hypothetical protein